MTKVEELRKRIIDNFGCGCCTLIELKEDDIDKLIQAVREETLTCKYCGHTFDMLYCTCDSFNDE